MINSERLPEIKDQIEKLRNQFELFSERVKATAEIEPRDKGPEDERRRILDFVKSSVESLDTVETRVEELSEMDKKADIEESMSRLNYIDELFYQMRQNIDEIAEEQYECKLGIFKQEMSNSIELLMEPIDFVPPAIRNEVVFLEQKYRPPTEGVNQLAILQELLEDIDENRILLKEFFEGYENGDTFVPGYNELRCMGGHLSKYQYYENLPEAYSEIKGNFFEYCKALEPFLKDKKGDPTFAKFYDQVRDNSRAIKKMSDVFDIDILVQQLEDRVQVKYSYDQNIKNARKHLEKFRKRKKSLIAYNIPEINKKEEELSVLMESEDEMNRFTSLMKEIRQAIKKRSIPFSQIESVFEKVVNKDFNILIGEQDVKDVSISITPHLEKKYGRGILERINTIILEVDFWYPPGMKAKIFENISETTQKIQADEPVDKQEFLKLMQNYDRELDQKVRATYLEKVKDLRGGAGCY